MFLPNDVIEYASVPVRAIRILWIEREQSLAYVFELGRPSALPRPAPLQALADDVRARRARLLQSDPYRARPNPAAPDSHRRLQARAWEAVSALHAHLPALYQPRWRATALAEHAARHGMSGATLMRYLRRYWERGQTPDALWPDYANSGARGRTRGATLGVKRGRPRKDRAGGANADPAMRAIFRAAADRHAALHAGTIAEFSRRAAYRQMLKDYFRDCAPDAVPSYGQFLYWLARDGAAVQVQETSR